MNVIFSRKGSDSGAIGKPSPVFSSKEIYSIPIPCASPSPLYSQVSPTVLTSNGFSSANCLANAVTRKSVGPHAHLDPDLDSGNLAKRPPGWSPCFGQRDRAASHLDKNGIKKGDLFLFYGWFDDFCPDTHRFSGNDRYIIWGWLQIGAIQRASSFSPWLAYHPHYAHCAAYRNNRIYVALKNLQLDGLRGWSGAGVFGKEHPSRVLTSAPGKRGIYPDKIVSFSNFTRHRQEHVWTSPTLATVIKYFV